ncbi:MAG: trypsin-like peptidase domain-containing protein, partial [Planctomycetota bacterium]
MRALGAPTLALLCASAPAQQLRSAQTAVVEAAKKVRPSVVTVLTPNARDYDLTGVVVAPGGIVLTLRAPLLDEGKLPKQVPVRFPGRRETVTARLIDEDAGSGTVLLRADIRRARPVAVGRAEDVRVGQWVLLVGNAFGAGRESAPTVSLGVVSGLVRDRNGP